MEEAIKELIKRKRELMGWSQPEIAKLLNMAQSNYAIWESKNIMITKKHEGNLKCLLDITDEEWSNAKAVTKRLVKTDNYERKYLQLLTKLQYKSDITSATINDYKVLKKYFPPELLAIIEDKLRLIDAIANIMNESKVASLLHKVNTSESINNEECKK